jgi:hypothetical protein
MEWNKSKNVNGLGPYSYKMMKEKWSSDVNEENHRNQQ